MTTRQSRTCMSLRRAAWMLSFVFRPQQCQCDLMVASSQLLTDLRPIRQRTLFAKHWHRRRRIEPLLQFAFIKGRDRLPTIQAGPAARRRQSAPRSCHTRRHEPAAGSCSRGRPGEVARYGLASEHCPPPSLRIGVRHGPVRAGEMHRSLSARLRSCRWVGRSQVGCCQKVAVERETCRDLG